MSEPETIDQRPLPPAFQPGGRFGWRGMLATAAVFVLAMLPNLHRLEFFDGVEHFNLATVLEMKRDGGNWLLPTLEGEPRVVKPPLTAWVTAVFVSPASVADLASRDPAVRAAAFDRFVFASRLPTLLCAAFMLLGVYQLGWAVTADRRTAVVGGVICAGCLLFLYQGRRATTDLQLAVWVTWTNALLATAVCRRQYRVGLLAGGVTLGLAMMAKGPHVALLLTVVPAAVYLLQERFSAASADSAGARIHPNAATEVADSAAVSDVRDRETVASPTSVAADSNELDRARKESATPVAASEKDRRSNALGSSVESGGASLDPNAATEVADSAAVSNVRDRATKESATPVVASEKDRPSDALGASVASSRSSTVPPTADRPHDPGAPRLAAPLAERVRTRPASGAAKRGAILTYTVGGLLSAFALGLGWYVYVLIKIPGVMQTWTREMFRRDALIGRAVMRPDPWYAYASLLGLLMPWTAWALWGGWLAIADRSRRSLRLPLLMVVLPIVVMSFFAEKKVRYLLPFTGVAAVLAAAAFAGGAVADERFEISSSPGGESSSPFSLREKIRMRTTDELHNSPNVVPQPLSKGDGLKSARGETSLIAKLPIRRIVEVITLLSAVWISVGVPIAGAVGLKGYRTWENRPWFSPTFAAGTALLAIAILAAGFMLARRSNLFWLIAIVLVTWLGSEIRLRGDFSSSGDADDRPQRLLAEQIWQAYPDAKIFTADPATLYGQLNRPAIVVSIFADRLVYPRPAVLPTHRAGSAANPGPPLILITDTIDTAPPRAPGWKRWLELPLRTGRRYVDVLEWFDDDD